MADKLTEERVIRDVERNPGCIPAHLSAEEKAILPTLIDTGRVVVRYQSGVQCYYTREQIQDMDTGAAMERETLPLAAGLHEDGTIHIYVDEVDSGLNIGLSDDGCLYVRVDESKRAMMVSA